MLLCDDVAEAPSIAQFDVRGCGASAAGCNARTRSWPGGSRQPDVSGSGWPGAIVYVGVARSERRSGRIISITTTTSTASASTATSHHG